MTSFMEFMLRWFGPGLYDLHMFVNRCIKAAVHFMNCGPEFLRFPCSMSMQLQSSTLEENVALCCEYLERDLWQMLS